MFVRWTAAAAGVVEYGVLCPGCFDPATVLILAHHCPFGSRFDGYLVFARDADSDLYLGLGSGPGLGIDFVVPWYAARFGHVCDGVYWGYDVVVAPKVLLGALVLLMPIRTNAATTSGSFFAAFGPFCYLVLVPAR